MRPRYKQTEVGVIPEDWEVVRFDEQFAISAGGDVQRELSSEYQDSMYPFPIYSNALTDAGLYGYCSYADHSADSITITARGTLGTATYRDHKYTAIGRVLVLEPKRESVGAFFAEYINNQVAFAIESTGVPQLTAPQIGAYLLAVPKFPEQSAIATALGDVDALLAALDALIAKKRDLKQAAMQQLLTGKTRLPGFSGEWEVRLLGDLVERFVGGGTPSRANKDYWGEEVPWVTVKDFATFHPRQSQEYITKVGLRNSASNLIPTGTLITSTRMALGKAVVYEVEVAINQDLKALLFKSEVSVDFMLDWFDFFGRQIDEVGGGSTVKGVSVNELKCLEVVLPKKEEQTAIAEVLSDMDVDIAALEQKREKTRLLKQSMMQELLTGRTRLAQPVAQPVSNVVPFPKQEVQSTERKANVHFIRSVFAAEIIERLHAEPTFGHVKCQKLIYLAEHMCKVDIDAHYHRNAAGPYDNRALRSIDSQLKQQKWFDAQKVGGRYQYVPLEKRGGHKQYFDSYFAEVGTVFDRVIDTFRSLDTERCEIVATLYEAWRDLLAKNDVTTDDAIVDQVLNHWHDAKRRIEEARWRKALVWMRDKGFVPEGAA